MRYAFFRLMARLGFWKLYRPEIKKELRDIVAGNGLVVSLLYDADLLPEQLAAQKELTLGLVEAYNRLEGVLLAFKYIELQGMRVTK